MMTLTLGVRDLASIRFAISPIWELVASLRVLRDPGAHVVHLPWVREVRPVLARTHDLDLLFGLVMTLPRHLPGFLAPAPTSPVAEPYAEMRAVADLDITVVRTELRHMFGHAAPEPLAALYRAPRRELRRLAEQLERYWDVAIGRHWPRMAGLLDGDVIHRGRHLAAAGPERMFNALDPAIAWDGGILTIDDKPDVPQPQALAGRGLVLVPSLFAWPLVYVKTAEPWSPLIRYPARGVGALWESASGNSDLAASLGATRAGLLAALANPATTSELARLTGLAPSGVSAHLSRLTRSGLAAPHRNGRIVVYTRTARGDALFT